MRAGTCCTVTFGEKIYPNKRRTSQVFCHKPSLTVFSISLSQHSADMTPSGDNEMLSVIVYCQADEKISALPGEFSIRYGGSGGRERGRWRVLQFPEKIHVIQQSLSCPTDRREIPRRGESYFSFSPADPLTAPDSPCHHGEVALPRPSAPPLKLFTEERKDVARLADSWS